MGNNDSDTDDSCVEAEEEEEEDDDVSAITQPLTVVTPHSAGKSKEGTQGWHLSSAQQKIHCWSPRRLTREWVNDSGVRRATVLVSLQNRDPSEDEGSGVDALVASNGLHIFIGE